MVAQHLGLDHAAGLHPGEAVVERDPGAGDRGGAGAAVGLDHVAVDGDLALAERLEIDDRAQAAADQPLDFDRASALLAGRGLTPGALQPRAWPLSHGGRRSSSVAVTSTWVSPNFTKHEPSAYFTTPRSSETGRSSSGCRRLGRICALLTAGRQAPAGAAFRA